MKYFEKGQTVYCSMNGQGVVKQILEKEKYGLEVHFQDGDYAYYTLDGRPALDKNITLSQNYIPPIVNKPIPEFELTFLQAMQSALEGKKATYERWEEDEYIVLSGDGFIVKVSQNQVYPYTIHIEDTTYKWRIIE